VTGTGGVEGEPVGDAGGEEEADAEAGGDADAAGEAGDGEWLAAVDPGLHAAAVADARSSQASQPGDPVWRCVAMIKPTSLCASGYVSGTIHALKQGTDPHPQSRGLKGYVRRTASAVRFVLSEWRNRATLNLSEVASHLV
jgi:hypothetical protein